MSGFDIERESLVLKGVLGPNLMDITANIARWIRLSGEPDELESFRWIEAKMKEYGYKTELVHHEGYISLPGPARLLADGEEIRCITHAFAVSTPPDGITARLTFVPANSPPDPALVRGTIVLTPGMASGNRTLELEAAGALAQIYIHDDHLHETSVSPIWGNPTPATIGSMPNTPGIAIRQGDARRLQERLNKGAVTVTIHASVDTRWRPIPLLMAELPGVDSDEYLLLSSHVDSWYYGAMDNGSANATTIEIARLMGLQRDSLRRGLRVAFWSGHSHGRFCGSAWYADRYWHDLREHCVGHVFVDSTGGMGATVVTELPIMAETKALAAEALLKVTGEILEGKRIGRFADQSFYGVGLPSTFGTFSEQPKNEAPGAISFKTGGKKSGGLGWWWHTADDTIDKVDEAFLVRDTGVYASAVYRILSMPVLPYDYRASVSELQEVAASLASAAGSQFDLSVLVTDLANLAERVATFYTKLATAGGNEARLRTANRTIMALAHHLVPVAYHENGLFDHDWMEPLQPIPSLQLVRRLVGLAPDSAQYGLTLTRLRRQYNWVVHEVKAAVAAVGEGLRALEE